MSERKSCNENRYLELPARQRQGGGRDDVVVVPLGPGIIGAPPMDLPISEMTPGRVFTFVLARWRRLQLPSTSYAPAAEDQGRTCDERQAWWAVAWCPAGMTLDDSKKAAQTQVGSTGGGRVPVTPGAHQWAPEARTAPPDMPPGLWLARPPRPGQFDALTAAPSLGPISASITRSAGSSRPVGSRLTITRAAPPSFASAGNPAAG